MLTARRRQTDINAPHKVTKISRKFTCPPVRFGFWYNIQMKRANLNLTVRTFHG